MWRNVDNQWRALDDMKASAAMMKSEIMKGGSKRLQTPVQTTHPKMESAISNRLYQARRCWQGGQRKRNRKATSTETEEQSKSVGDDNEDLDPPAASVSGDRRTIMAIGSILDPSTTA